MSSKKSETAVYGCYPALLKFYQCRVDVLQSQIFLRGEISLAVMFVTRRETLGTRLNGALNIPQGRAVKCFTSVRIIASSRLILWEVTERLPPFPPPLKREYSVL